MKIFSVATSLETVLACDQLGRLGHIAPDAVAANRLFLVVTACPDPQRKVCLLEAPGLPGGIRVQDRDPEQLLTLHQHRAADAYFSLQTAAPERILRPGPADPHGFGLVSFGDLTTAEPLLFHLITAPEVSTIGILSRLDDDFSFSRESFDWILASNDTSFWPLVPGFLEVLDIENIRGAWSSAKRSSVHDQLYQPITSVSKSKFSDFAGYTADKLLHLSSQFGWSIGRYSYGNPTIFEPGLGKLTIGRYCSLADPHIILGNHSTASAASYPFMMLWTQWPGTRVGLEDHRPRDVVIGNDVWIGVGAIILPGAVIGDGVVVAAGAVVSGTIAPYSICAGVPAKVIRKRFNDQTIARLLALRWWNWDEAAVDRFIHLLLSPDLGAFLAAAEAEFGSLGSLSELIVE